MKSKRTIEIEYRIEVPIQVSATFYPEVKVSRLYPAEPAHIEIDWIKYATDEEWTKILKIHEDRIRQACYAALEE